MSLTLMKSPSASELSMYLSLNKLLKAFIFFPEEIAFLLSKYLTEFSRYSHELFIFKRV